MINPVLKRLRDNGIVIYCLVRVNSLIGQVIEANELPTGQATKP